MKTPLTVGLLFGALLLGSAAAQDNKVREWTSTDGHKLKAALVRSETVYVLRKEDGTEVRVPADSLSPASRALAQRILAQPAQAAGGVQTIQGEVVTVLDGNTLILLDQAGVPHRVRLSGIDSPEDAQDHATDARKALAEKVFRRQVRVESKGRDGRKQVLGAVYLDKRWINREMVEQGWAWHVKDAPDAKTLAAAESQARAAKAGLWQKPNPTPPWEWRQKRPKPAVPRKPKPPDPVVFVTATGTKYHRAGCRHLSKGHIHIPLSQARARYSPCSVCNPPR